MRLSGKRMPMRSKELFCTFKKKDCVQQCARAYLQLLSLRLSSFFRWGVHMCIFGAQSVKWIGRKNRPHI